jgi:hypothetical protein
MPTIWLSSVASSHPAKVTFSVNYSLIISIVALLFTIGSFWWINARRGKLRSFEPLSFAAMIRTDNSVFRFPLVLYNNGAKPIVVQNLRMRFPKETGVSVFGWRTMRSEVEPHAGEETYLPAGFSVPGRTAEQVFVELDGTFPNAAPEPRIYAAAIETKLGRVWYHLIFTWIILPSQISILLIVMSPLLSARKRSRRQNQNCRRSHSCPTILIGQV